MAKPDAQMTKWLKWAAIAVAFVMFVISWCLMTYSVWNR